MGEKHGVKREEEERRERRGEVEKEGGKENWNGVGGWEMGYLAGLGLGMGGARPVGLSRSSVVGPIFGVTWPASSFCRCRLHPQRDKSS